jgi:glyoxylase-like metal-dependent hydrolase (beta-lactamase superfamily II)
MTRDTTPGASTRFTEIADRVFVGRFPQWDVNVGVVVGSAGICVIDTRGTLRQGEEVRDAVTRLAPPGVVTHVVNTHVHFDHVLGNAAFPGARKTAHANAVAAMADHVAAIRAACAQDPASSEEFGYTTADLEDLVASPLAIPESSFTSTGSIDLGDRGLLLSYAGRGHTDGDLAAAVSDVPVVFLGDLIEEVSHPSYGSDCCPLDWADTLTAHLAGWPVGALVVPGHGLPVDRDFVAAQRDAVAAVAAVVRDRHTAGWSLEDAIREPDARLPYPVEDLADAFRRGWADLDRQVRRPGRRR